MLRNTVVTSGILGGGQRGESPVNYSSGISPDTLARILELNSSFCYILALPLSVKRFSPDVALFGHICFGLGPVDLHRVWCHALFKGKAMRTRLKVVCCGLTSKLLSRTTDDCHPWHSNLCHGQMTTFILRVDRDVILRRFREEEAPSTGFTETI